MTSHASRVKRGFTVAEMMASLAILAVVGVLVAQWFAMAALQQAQLESQRYAMQMSSNLMERVFALPWEELADERAAALAMEAAEATDCECSASVTDVEPGDSPLRSKRILVRVVPNHGPAAAFELTAWRHAREDEP